MTVSSSAVLAMPIVGAVSPTSTASSGAAPAGRAVHCGSPRTFAPTRAGVDVVGWWHGAQARGARWWDRRDAGREPAVAPLRRRRPHLRRDDRRHGRRPAYARSAAGSKGAWLHMT